METGVDWPLPVTTLVLMICLLHLTQPNYCLCTWLSSGLGFAQCVWRVADREYDLMRLSTLLSTCSHLVLIYPQVALLSKTMPVLNQKLFAACFCAHGLQRGVGLLTDILILLSLKQYFHIHVIDSPFQPLLRGHKCGGQIDWNNFKTRKVNI